eukprot:TRINITY_DN5103_c0_g1_i1.p1 TRINITY_DN5103_c0_g1~~TRINITY_DN5103_c0_g1_i1.p1  ORF type:complete len:314 (-),score=50.40 TRINITY_DN5103_c0_g1_i1:358-1299(-)
MTAMAALGKGIASFSCVSTTTREGQKNAGLLLETRFLNSRPVQSAACRGHRREPSAASRVSCQVSSRLGFSSESVRGMQEQMMPRVSEMDPSAMLYGQRIVWLGGQVDDLSADSLISQLLLLDAMDPTKDIKLLINSPGGSVTAGMGIYDAMKLCRADVSTICFGLAASMGAFLLSAGTKGKRYCMPNARVMIHQPLGGVGGSAMDMGLQMREMMYHKIKLNKILSRITGKTEEQIEIDTDRDNFLNPWEAVEYGLVDGVIGAENPNHIAPIGEIKEPPRSRINPYWEVKEGRARREFPSEMKLIKELADKAK